MTKKKKNETIITPKKVLQKILSYSSLYGPSRDEPTKHTIINAVKLIFKKGEVSAYTKRHPVQTIITSMTIKDDGIKGSGEISIGEAAQVVGGRNADSKSWKSTYERLTDPVSISIDKNTVYFNRGEDYELRISLINDYIDKMNIESDEFHKRITEDDNGYLLQDDKSIGSRIRVLGKNFKDIIDDSRVMDTQEFHFKVENDTQNELVMILGDSSRSSKRKIKLIESELDEGEIDGKIFDGLEAFAHAIEEDGMVDIYYHPKLKKFSFHQLTDDENLRVFLQGGALNIKQK